MKTIGATAFKARCLRILDEVAHTGEPIVITKRGRPVAELVRPLPRTRGKRGRYPQDALKGTGKILGDIISPPLPPEAWDANRGKLI